MLKGIAHSLARLQIRAPGANEHRSWSVSLHLCIGAVFAAVILLLGAVLISYSYERHKDLAIATAGELFEHITQQTASNIGELYAPVEVLVDLTASLPLVSTGKSENLEELLDFFAGSLRSTPQISSMYVGFSDGDFYLVRSIKGLPSTGSKLAAPANTEFIVEHIQRERDQPERYSTQYYDRHLQKLELETGFITGYDPRVRGWYNQAIRTKNPVTTDFYPFFSTLETGVTIAKQVDAENAVVGADITLKDVSRKLLRESLTADTEVIVFTESGTVLGYRDAALLESKSLKSGRQVLRAPHINDLKRPVLEQLFNSFINGSRDSHFSITVAEEQWFGSIKPVVFGPDNGKSVFMAIFVPEEELLSDLQTVRMQSVAISLIMLAAVLPLVWWLAKNLANLTRRLALEAGRIQRLNFDIRKIKRSRIREIDTLSVSMGEMSRSIRRFADLSKAVTGEKGLGSLAEVAVRETCNACNAQYGGLWLVSGDRSSLYLIHEQVRETEISLESSQPHYDITLNTELEAGLQRLSLNAKDPDRLQAETYAVTERRSIIIDHTSKDEGFRFASDHQVSTMLVPLITAKGSCVGLLQLGDRTPQGQSSTAVFNTAALSHIEALASTITVAIDNQQLMQSHYNTFESLIKVLAAATDAKSAHTGGHCQRVPVLTNMLAEAASTSSNPAFTNFSLTPAARRELHVASWLHDCGKVTTPEHVADKATKLEMVYNRIHEIRMRFEVILRDIHIRYHEILLEQPNADADKLRALMEAETAQLHEDFSFIAQSNMGSEFMTPADLNRLNTIATRTWTRHFDNTIGLSVKERSLQPQGSEEASQSDGQNVEFLLADKCEHKVPRAHADRAWGENPHGFNMDVPEHEYNHGELYNLTIEKGTLTPEERFKVNDHIVQTQIMLNSIPFPSELQRVPEIAGNHHERLDGSGFPRRLTGEQLSVEDRIMVIADVFEALTANDRPYKNAKSLSESISLMNDMVDKGYICADLFNLFLESRVYEQYAKDYLHTSQIDTLDFYTFTQAGKERQKRTNQDVV